MNLHQEVRLIRRKIDILLEELQCKVAEAIPASHPEGKILQDAENYERIYPLHIGGTTFKGTKPTGLLFDGKRMEVKTWKMVFCEILKRCNEDLEKHNALLKLRGKIAGRERILLSHTEDGMRKPHKIADNLYIETHYDTETLLHILMVRILAPIGYDYSTISVAVRN